MAKSKKKAKKPAKAKKSKPTGKKSAPKKKPISKKKPVSKKKPTPKKKPALKKKPAKAARKPVKTAKKVAKTTKPKKPAKAKQVTAPKPKKKETIKSQKSPFLIAKKPSVIQKELPESKSAQSKLGQKFLDTQYKKLLDLRDHILNQMQGVAQNGLRSRDEGSGSSAFGMHQADAGSDAYEKDFALSLLSQEQDALYEIEEAIKRVENKTYGVCEMSGKIIPRARLEAIPFARYTVECQAMFERENRGRNRWDTNPQFMDSTDNFFEEEEESDDEDKIKPKE